MKWWIILSSTIIIPLSPPPPPCFSSSFFVSRLVCLLSNVKNCLMSRFWFCLRVRSTCQKMTILFLLLFWFFFSFYGSDMESIQSRSFSIELLIKMTSFVTFRFVINSNYCFSFFFHLLFHFNKWTKHSSSFIYSMPAFQLNISSSVIHTYPFSMFFPTRVPSPILPIPFICIFPPFPKFISPSTICPIFFIFFFVQSFSSFRRVGEGRS